MVVIIYSGLSVVEQIEEYVYMMVETAVSIEERERDASCSSWRGANGAIYANQYSTLQNLTSRRVVAREAAERGSSRVLKEGNKSDGMAPDGNNACAVEKDRRLIRHQYLLIRMSVLEGVSAKAPFHHHDDVSESRSMST